MNLVRSICFFLLAASCTGTITSEAAEGAEKTEEYSDASSDEKGAIMRTQVFEETPGNIANPERGFYVGVDLFNEGTMANVRERGSSLAIALVRLDSYRTSEISAAFLADLSLGFEQARGHGIKLILRFMYNSSFSEDASRDQILAHISQLTPLLQANADVIAVMQAGFIGAWGEWHGSTNGLDNFSDRQAILEALLTALPENRSVQVRTPMFKRDLWNAPTTSPENVITDTPQARVGHHNDCFLASASDFGTFASPLEDWRGYLAQDTRFVPMGGETCVVNAPRTDCQQAIDDMEGFHWSYLNREYKVEVLADWQAQGCLDEVESRLGYRIVLDSVTHPETAKAGQTIAVEVALHNRGFAAPFNERPVYLVLRGASDTQVARVDGIDPRLWLAGESNTHSLRVSLPSSMESGTYSVALWLPDASTLLANDSRYAMRFASESTWSEDSGENLLIPELVIDASSSQDEGSALLVAVH